MSRLEAALRRARETGRKALVPFLTGGYPDLETFADLLLAAQAAGADAVEVGIPFSDPSADGPVIQGASAQALAGGATVPAILEQVARARARGLGIPLLVMTYYNPVLARGGERFAREARGAGADGVLVVDLPPEEAGEFAPAARAAGLDTVFLVAPTTPQERIARVVAGCRGFVYCVGVTGVTGDRAPVAEAVEALVARIRPHTALPVLVGFGVGDVPSARSVARTADGVIVGSALLRAVGGRRGAAAVKAARTFLEALRAGLDEPGPG